MPYGRKIVGGNVILPSLVVGSAIGGAIALSRKRPRRRKKKARAHRKHRSRKSSAHKANSQRKRRSHSRSRSGSKRRGMSASFLRELRRKHHLGEFKK